MPTIWDEIDTIKERLNDLERRDTVLVEEALTLYNNEKFEEELQQLCSKIRKLVRRLGRVHIDLYSDN